MPPISSPHTLFAEAALENPRRTSSQSRYCYRFPALAQEESVGCFAGTTPAQTFARLEAFEESSRVALTGLPVLPMRLPPVYTYFGQFVNHDISAPVGDVVTQRARPAGQGVIGTTDPGGLDRTRRAKAHIILENFFNEQANPLSMDSLYGDADGPRSADADIAALYDPDGKRFRLGVTRPEDEVIFTNAGKDPARVIHAKGARDILRRNHRPLIADRRNDENLIISQLHLALMLFHNKMVSALEGTVAEKDCFAAARQQVMLHYHWLILHDFLANLLSPTVLQTPLAQRPQTLPQAGVVPLEFTTAAFRFGHSMVGSAYDFNANFGRGGRIKTKASLNDLFEFTSHRNMGQPRMRKTLQLPDHWVIDWDRMTKTRAAGGAEQIDINFAHDMLNAMGTPEIAVHGSILFRNLMRGFHRRIPFGQVLARAYGQAPLGEADIHAVLPAGDGKNPEARALREIATDLGFLKETPAWLYFLAEARHHEQGERVGPTASHIIADTITGLMRFLPHSVLNHAGGGWHPAQSPVTGPGEAPLTSIRALLLFAVKDTAVPVAPA